MDYEEEEQSSIHNHNGSVNDEEEQPQFGGIVSGSIRVSNRAGSIHGSIIGTHTETTINQIDDYDNASEGVGRK